MEQASREKTEDSSLLQLFVEYMKPISNTEENKKKKKKSMERRSNDAVVTSLEYRKMQTAWELILPILLECKDNVNYIKGTSCQTFLHCFLEHYAMENCSADQRLKDIKIVKTCAEKGASIIIPDRNGNAPLGMAITKGRLDLVRIMLRCSISADLNTQNVFGDTILHIILESFANSKENIANYFVYVVKISNLVNSGANLNLANCHGMTPVHYAAKYGFLEILQIFARFEANFNALTIDGDNALLSMCFELTPSAGRVTLKMLETISFLLRKGCDVKWKNRYGFTCLHYASQSPRLDVLELLIKAGADPNAIAEDGSTTLHAATMLGTLETVGYLLDCGVDPQKRDSVCGYTLLHTAALNRDYKVMQLMLEKGLKLHDSCDANGLTPLHLASLYGNVQVVKELIKLYAPVNHRDNIGRYTPLHLASVRGKLSIVKGCLNYGSKYYSLMRRCLKLVSTHSESSCEIIDALVEAGANLDTRDALGRTPLHLAALQRNSDVVKALLRHGAFVEVQDNEGLLPLHNVLRSHNSNGLSFMFRYGVDVNDLVTPLNDFRKIMSNYVYDYNDVRTTLLQYIVTLQAADLPVDKLYKTYIRRAKLKGYYEGCVREVEKLKRRNVTKTISFYDFIQRNSKQHLTFSIDDFFPDLRTDFPYFVRVIQGRYRAYCARDSLMQLAKAAFNRLTAVCWPDLCSEPIFCYLSNKDLRALVDSIDT